MFRLLLKYYLRQRDASYCHKKLKSSQILYKSFITFLIRKRLTFIIAITLNYKYTVDFFLIGFYGAPTQFRLYGAEQER